MPDTIYLDSAATTPLHPIALEAMLPYLTGRFGNPSATYGLAREAQKAIDDARKAVASVLGCRTSDIVFTSGGTESINTSLKGVAFAQMKARAGNHIVTTAVEHHAVLHTCNYLEQYGFEVTYLPVDAYGMVDPDDVARAITEQTVLVSVMQANNEVGTIQPVAEIAKLTGERARALHKRIPVHTDAVQAAGALPIDVDSLGVDLLSLSGHKFGGPKGTGALFIRRGTPFAPQISGGGQERQRRAGTENVAGTVGIGVALRLAEESRVASVEAMTELRDRFIEAIMSTIPDSRLNGHPTERLANNINVSFKGVRGDKLVLELDRHGIAASAGAACGSSTWEPSHVLLAMGLGMPDVVGGLRLSLSAENGDSDLEGLMAVLPEAVASLRPVAAAS
ncbi:MAG TPA: aminotransferase class V-fold PLP-dependent enzyme [Dehalococcoidia bacterium]|nr:aminotransferase class V-fold PLP-dependent enzyme [Dehalococcoidia bacterium]